MRGPKTRQRVGWGGSEGVERIAWIRDRGAQPRGVRVGQARDPPKGRAPREKSRVRRVRARVRRAKGSRVVDDVSPGRVDAPDARARAPQPPKTHASPQPWGAARKAGLRRGARPETPRGAGDDEISRGAKARTIPRATGQDVEPICAARARRIATSDVSNTARGDPRLNRNLRAAITEHALGCRRERKREVARLEASRRPSVSARVPSVKLRTRSARPETARACAECATAARTGRVETNALCQFLVLFLQRQIPSSSARPPNGPPGWNFPTNKRLDRRKSRHQPGLILGRARIQSEGVDREIVRRTRVPRADTNLELQTETSWAHSRSVYRWYRRFFYPEPFRALDFYFSLYVFAKRGGISGYDVRRGCRPGADTRARAGARRTRSIVESAFVHAGSLAARPGAFGSRAAPRCSRVSCSSWRLRRRAKRPAGSREPRRSRCGAFARARWRR